MIVYLVLSIITSSLLYVILKKFIFWKIETSHGIIINYYTAAVFSFLINPVKNQEQLHELNDYWYISAFIGFLFITVFYIIAKTSQVSGITVASVASKMSMVIPISAGIIIFSDSITLVKITGILLAIPAVILTAKPATSNNNNFQFSLKNTILPVLLFLGAGLVDTTIKLAQHFYINEDNRNVVIMSIFGFAGVFGTFRLFYEIYYLKRKLVYRSIVGGVILGIVNYFSLYFLIKCLGSPGAESSTIFAIVNIGVVLVSFILGIILFKEYVTKLKITGIVLAITAILLLSLT